jgi:oligopeptidase B
MKIIFTTLILFLIQGDMMKKEAINPPLAKKIPYTFELHGEKVQDEYHWLRASGWPDKITDEAVLSYLKEENAYFDNYMDLLADKKDMFFEELKGRIKLADQSTYIKKDDYFYYTRTEEDKDYTIYCRKFGSTSAPEEILLDVNELAKDQKYTSIGSFSISPDHKLIAYSVDFTGGEKYTLKIFNLETKIYLADQIENTIGSIVWHEDQSGLFYTPTDDKWRHDKVLFHKLGTKNIDDNLIFHEKDPLYYVSVGKSSSKDYIFITVSGHDSNEMYFITMTDKTFTPQLVLARKDRIQYSIDHNGPFFYQYTNDGAKNFQILRAESNDYSATKPWSTYIAEKKDKYLSSFDLTQNYLLMDYKVKGLAELVAQNLDNEAQQVLNFPENTYTASIYSTNFKENDIRVDYSSLARPNTVYSYDFNSNELSTLKVQEIPSGFDPEEYATERLFVKTDGVEVPVSLFYKKSLFKGDGSNPLYLYGYGSYGLSIAPSFRNSAVSLVNRGFIYAVAHIRGGDDLGHDWYEAAKFLNKKRTFSDFIAVADELISLNYTSEGNIVIVGGSAGGMLVGNVINQRPELFKAAIAHVPFVDVLNTMLDENLPLTPGEYKEWGNPKDKDYFEYMKSYSPYDNVSQQNYPSLFVTAGLSDPRVGYWEAAKWVARLRDRKLGDNIIIFKTNMSFGHAGASGRFDYLKEAADDLVFITNIFKVK